MLKRGQKICKYCKAVNAARSRICMSCELEFKPKNLPVRNEIINWKELSPGDFVKIIVGSGPYYPSKKDTENSKAGERISMGDIGVYKVVKIVDNGIYAFGATNKNAGYTFIYMGEPYISEQTGIHFEPHRIKRVKLKCRT